MAYLAILEILNTRLKQKYTLTQIHEYAKLLSHHYFNKSRIELITQATSLCDAQIESIHHISEQLLQDKPIQYILGYTHFYNMQLIVNEHTLIPRPETEEMVDIIIRTESTPKSILDIGTGSGCIAIALAKNYGITVDALDISTAALYVARQNASIQNVSVRYYKQNILTTIKLPLYDLIVANPPYIAPDEVLDNNVYNYEPHLALFTNNNVLEFYIKIIDFRMNATIYFECNQLYAHHVADYARNSGYNAQLVTDINGHNRFVILRPRL